MKIVLNEEKSNVLLKSYCDLHSHETTKSSSNCEVDFISRNVNEIDQKSKNTNPQNEFWKYVDINKVFQEVYMNL